MIDGISVWELSREDFTRLEGEVRDGTFDVDNIAELEEAAKNRFYGSGKGEDYEEGPVKTLNVSGRIMPESNIMTYLMGGTSVEAMKKKLDRAEENPNIRQVVMRFNSPGGSATGVPSLTAKIRNMETQTVAYGDKMLSAAYHIASAADKVYASPNALVGSVGVYALLSSRKDKMEEEGIQTEVVRSVPGKAKPHPAEQLDEESVKQAQKIVDRTHEEFVKSVAKNRNLSQDYVNNTMADGKVRVGEDAEEEEFTDDTMTMEELFEGFTYDESADASRMEQENEFLRSELADSKAKLNEASEKIDSLSSRVEDLEAEEETGKIERLLDGAIDTDQKFAPGRREELRETAENMAESDNLDAFEQMIEATPEGAAAPSDPVETADDADETTQDDAVQRLEQKNLIPVHTEDEAEAQDKLGSEYNPETEEGTYFKVWKVEQYL